MKNDLKTGSEAQLKPIKKVSGIMKMTFLMLLLIISGAGAIETHSQVSRVNITVKSVPCRDVLNGFSDGSL
jgi:hypothetical protein